MKALKNISLTFGITVAIAYLSTSAWAAIAPISFPVTMSEAVNVVTTGGTPRIALDVGGVTRYAEYSAGTGTPNLIFNYTPTIGDVDLDGISIPSGVIDLNGGAIADTAGNPATLTFTPPNTSGVRVNYPSLGMDFVVDADGRYTLNGTAYNDLTSFLTATGGTFTRNSIATYFDSTGTLQTASSNTPRFDYDPVTLQPKGILIEESRTNGVRNSMMIGASIGVLPTNWVVQAASGITTAVVGTGAENGINYVDIRISGTPTAPGFPAIFIEAGNVTAASNSQTWTGSAYFKLIGGSFTNFGSKSFSSQIFNGAGAYLSGSGGTTLNATSSALISQRVIFTTTIANPSTGYIRPMVNFSVTTGLPVDLTLRIGAPQLEQGAFATSYIPTTTAAVTRAADTLTMPTGSWYSAATGSLFASSDTIPYNASLSGAISISFFNDNSPSNQWGLRYDTGGTLTASPFIRGGVNQTTIYTPPVLTGTNRTAHAMSVGTRSTIANGGPVQTGTYSSTPTISFLNIGNNLSTSYLNGYLKTIKYYPSRVSDTQLQLLTQ